MIMFDDVKFETKLTCFFHPEFITEYFAMCMEKAGIECVYSKQGELNNSCFNMCNFLEDQGKLVNQAEIPEKYRIRYTDMVRSMFKFRDAGYDADNSEYGGYLDEIGVIISKVNVDDLFQKSLELLIEPIESEFKVYLEQRAEELKQQEIERRNKCKRIQEQIRIDMQQGIFMEKVQEIGKVAYDYQLKDNESQVAIYSDVDMMNRVLRRDSTQISTFESKEKARFCIEKAILDKIEVILDWESLHKLNEDTFTILKEYDQPVGKGYIKDKRRQTIKEYTTNKMYLELVLDSKNAYGFSLLLSYPDMRDEDIKPTGQSLKNIVVQTPIYQKTNPIRQAYMEYQVDLEYDKYLVTYCEDPCWDAPNNMLWVHIPTNHPNIEHIVRIEEYGSIELCSVNGEWRYDEDQGKEDCDEKIETKYSRKAEELGLIDYFSKFPRFNVNSDNNELVDMFAKSYPDVVEFVKWLNQLVEKRKKIKGELYYLE